MFHKSLISYIKIFHISNQGDWEIMAIYLLSYIYNFMFSFISVISIWLFLFRDSFLCLNYISFILFIFSSNSFNIFIVIILKFFHLNSTSGSSVELLLFSIDFFPLDFGSHCLVSSQVF